MKQRLDLVAGLTLIEPERDIPFAPSLVIGASVNESPLGSVRKQSDLLLTLAQPLNHTGDTAPAGADSYLLHFVVKDGKNNTLLPRPDATRFQILASQEALPPLCADSARLLPLQSRKLQHILEHGIEERRLNAQILSTLLCLHGTAQAVRQGAGQGLPFGRKEVWQARRCDKKAAMFQARPPRKLSNGLQLSGHLRCLGQADFNRHREHSRSLPQVIALGKNGCQNPFLFLLQTGEEFREVA